MYAIHNALGFYKSVYEYTYGRWHEGLAITLLKGIAWLSPIFLNFNGWTYDSKINERAAGTM